MRIGSNRFSHHPLLEFSHKKTISSLFIMYQGASLLRIMNVTQYKRVAMEFRFRQYLQEDLGGDAHRTRTTLWGKNQGPVSVESGDGFHLKVWL